MGGDHLSRRPAYVAGWIAQRVPPITSLQIAEGGRCAVQESGIAAAFIVTSFSRWGRDRERHVLQHGLPTPKNEVPTLEEFAPRFLEGMRRRIVRSRVASRPKRRSSGCIWF